MVTYRVLTSTVSMGRRIEIELGRVVADDLEQAARIAAFRHPSGLAGFTDPRVEELQGTSRREIAR